LKIYHLSEFPKETIKTSVKIPVMDKHTNSEQWVNEVMDSLNGIRKMPPSPGMYEKVMLGINSQAHKGKQIIALPARIAAAAILLLVINVASLIHFSRKEHTHMQAQQNVYQAMNEDISSLSEDNY